MNTSYNAIMQHAHALLLYIYYAATMLLSAQWLYNSNNSTYAAMIQQVRNFSAPSFKLDFRVQQKC